MNNKGVALCCFSWAVAPTQQLHNNKTFLSLYRLLQFCSWLGFLFLTLGGIKSQTFCNCPWERAGHFHHGLKLKRNKWHTLVYGNYTCGVWWQPGGAPSNFKIRNSSICTSLYWRCLQRLWLKPVYGFEACHHAVLLISLKRHKGVKLDQFWCNFILQSSWTFGGMPVIYYCQGALRSQVEVSVHSVLLLYTAVF